MKESYIITFNEVTFLKWYKMMVVSTTNDIYITKYLVDALCSIVNFRLYKENTYVHP